MSGEKYGAVLQISDGTSIWKKNSINL